MRQKSLFAAALVIVTMLLPVSASAQFNLRNLSKKAKEKSRTR